MTAVLTDPNALKPNDDPRGIEATSEETRSPYVSVSVDLDGKTWTVGSILHGPHVADTDIAEAVVNAGFAVAGLGGRSLYVAMQRAVALHAVEPTPPALPAPAEQAVDEPEQAEPPALASVEEPAEPDVDQADTEPAEPEAEPEVEQSKAERAPRRIRKDLGQTETSDAE